MSINIENIFCIIQDSMFLILAAVVCFKNNGDFHIDIFQRIFKQITAFGYFNLNLIFFSSKWYLQKTFSALYCQ